MSDVTISQIPVNSLYIGTAGDGFPVLLNMKNSDIGAILISGDGACGKTKLLQKIALGIISFYTPAEVEFAVVTQSPSEWEAFSHSQNCTAIIDANERGTFLEERLSAFVTWAKKNKDSDSFLVLLFDCLDIAPKMSKDAQQSFRWILQRGSEKGVWCFTTVNADVKKGIGEWTWHFRTKFIGRTESERFFLNAGSEFAMADKEHNDWLIFSI